MVRVVIADDHPIFAEGVAAVLAPHPGIEVVAIARDGRGALAAVDAHAPDVVILDVAMPEPDGIAVCRRIARTSPSTRVVVLSASAEMDDVAAAIRAGADAYFTKHMPVEELAARLADIAAGRRMLSEDVVDVLFSVIQSSAGIDVPNDALSPRESEVLALVAQELTNRQIATRLHLSEQTVKNHLTNAYEKLGVHSRFEAVQRAHDLHLL